MNDADHGIKQLRDMGISKLIWGPIESELAMLREALHLSRDVIERIAGPVGCGVEYGSFKHYCGQVRTAIDEVLGSTGNTYDRTRFTLDEIRDAWVVAHGLNYEQYWKPLLAELTIPNGDIRQIDDTASVSHKSTAEGQE